MTKLTTLYDDVVRQLGPLALQSKEDNLRKVVCALRRKDGGQILNLFVKWPEGSIRRKHIKRVAKWLKVRPNELHITAVTFVELQEQMNHG